MSGIAHKNASSLPDRFFLSSSASLADAVATAVANRVNSKKDLEGALNFARSIRGILGVVIILKNSLISWGKVEFAQ